MFHDLFWALYWIDILSNLPSTMLGGAACIGVLFIGAVGFTYLSYDYDLDRARKLSCIYAWIASVVYVFVLVLSFIPSKQTMYMMLGVRTTDNIVNSETGKKLQELLNKQIDSYLEKFSK